MPTFANDAELLRRYARERDEDAFAELVQRYVALVYHAAQRQLGAEAHAAEDVTQTVFTRLARKAAALANHSSVAGWLHATTRFAAAETLRAERRRRARELEACLMQESAGESSEVEWTQLRPVLDEALNELDTADREAVLLRFFVQLPHAQIGTRLHVSENTARMRVERALGKLHALLQRRGITSTAAALGLALTTQAGAGTPAGLAGAVTTKALANAGAAIGPGIWATFLTTMSTTKLSGALLAAVAFVAALGTATHQIHARRLEDATYAAAVATRAAALARAGAAETRAQRAEQDAADLERRVADARAKAASGAAAPSSNAATPRSAAAAPDERIEGGNAFMARHPEVKSALHAYAKGRALFAFRELFEALGLTPEQIEEVAVGRHLGMGAMLDGGKNVSLVSGDFGEGSKPFERLRATLGEDGYRKYQEASRALDARELVVKVAGALQFTEAPLSPPHADTLAALITRHRTPGSGWKPQAYDWDAIHAQAATWMSPTQLNVLAGLRARDRFQQALNEPLPETPAAPVKGTP